MILNGLQIVIDVTVHKNGRLVAAPQVELTQEPGKQPELSISWEDEEQVVAWMQSAIDEFHRQKKLGLRD